MTNKQKERALEQLYELRKIAERVDFWARLTQAEAARLLDRNYNLNGEYDVDIINGEYDVLVNDVAETLAYRLDMTREYLNDYVRELDDYVCNAQCGFYSDDDDDATEVATQGADASGNA